MAITIGKWSGIGYIVIAPDGVSQKYMISGGYSGGSTIDPVPLYYLINTALDIAMIAESVMLLAGTLAAMSTLAFGPVALVVLSVVSITFLAIDIMEQSFLLYDYEINDNMESGLQIWANTATNSFMTLATMGIGKGISKIGSAVNEIRLSRTYGKIVVRNIKDYGFTVNEINSRVNKFKALGLSQSTIDTLLKDSKCMYLNDDILGVIGKRGSDQRILAELVLRNEDEFSSKLVKITSKSKYVDEWIEFVISNDGLKCKETNIIGKINTELDEVDFVKSIIYEDKNAKGLYMDNPDVPQTEEQWAQKQILKKGSNRIDAINQEEFRITTLDKNSETIELNFMFSEIKEINNYVFRINADTPELRSAVETCLKELREKYPKYNFSAIYGE